MKDYSKIKTVEELLVLEGDANLYDDSPEFENDNPYGVKFMPDLSDEELEDAMAWAPYTRGVMLVTGPAGAGKTMLGNTLGWKFKRYFGKTVFLDYMPRRAFGVYHPFNEAVLVEQLARMGNVATGEVMGAKKEQLEGMVSEWVSQQGTVFLKNSVLVLDEFKRYFHNRRPHNPMGILLSQVCDIWRHLDILIIGLAIDKKELDRFSCIPKLTYEVCCEWLLGSTLEKYELWPKSCKATIYPLRYIGIAGQGVLDVAGPPDTFVVEGGKPRAALGGKRYIDLYNTKDPKVIYPPTSMIKKLRKS